MNVEFRKNGSCGVAALEGDVKASNVASLREQFTTWLKANPDVNVLVLDLSQVPMMDSSGLGMVVSLLKKMSERKGDLRLAALSEKVRMLVEITRLQTVLDIYDSVDKAENA